MAVIDVKLVRNVERSMWKIDDNKYRHTCTMCITIQEIYVSNHLEELDLEKLEKERGRE